MKLKFDKMSYVLKRTLDREQQDFKYEYYSESRNKLVDFKKFDDLEKKIDEKFRKIQIFILLIDFISNFD